MKKKLIDLLILLVLSSFLVFILFQGFRMLYYLWFK